MRDLKLVSSSTGNAALWIVSTKVIGATKFISTLQELGWGPIQGTVSR